MDYSVSDYDIVAILLFPLSPFPEKDSAIVLGGFVLNKQIALFSTSQCWVVTDSDFIQCWFKDV